MKKFDANQELARLAQNSRGTDKKTRAIFERTIEELLERNGGLIWSTHKLLTSRSDAPYIDDILNTCRFAIIKALDTYKFGKGAKFTSWWVIHMRASVQMWRRDQSGEVYLKQINLDRKPILKSYEESGNIEGIKFLVKRMKQYAAHTDVELDRKNHFDGNNYEVDLKELSLDSDGGGVMGSFSVLGLQGGESLTDLYRLVDNILGPDARLYDYQKSLLDLRYVQGLTLESIAEIKNRSKEWVRKKITIVEDKIKEALNSELTT